MSAARRGHPAGRGQPATQGARASSATRTVTSSTPFQPQVMQRIYLAQARQDTSRRREALADLPAVPFIRSGPRSCAITTSLAHHQPQRRASGRWCLAFGPGSEEQPTDAGCASAGLVGAGRPPATHPHGLQPAGFPPPGTPVLFYGDRTARIFDQRDRRLVGHTLRSVRRRGRGSTQRAAVSARFTEARHRRRRQRRRPSVVDLGRCSTTSSERSIRRRRGDRSTAPHVAGHRQRPPAEGPPMRLGRVHGQAAQFPAPTLPPTCSSMTSRTRWCR